MALVSVAVLLLLLGAIVLYQQLQMPAEPPSKGPIPVEQPPMTAESTPNPVTGVSSAPGTQVAESQSDTGAAAPPEDPAAPPEDPAAPQAPPDFLTAPLAGNPIVVKTYHSLDQAYGDFRLYPAIAYATEPGRSVLAPAPGTVAAIDEDPAEGLTLVLAHGGGLTTRYSGLGKVLVTEGEQVESGAIIAQTGQPGPARDELGPHLAFQVRLGNTPVDPTTYLQD